MSTIPAPIHLPTSRTSPGFLIVPPKIVSEAEEPRKIPDIAKSIGPGCPARSGTHQRVGRTLTGATVQANTCPPVHVGERVHPLRPCQVSHMPPGLPSSPSRTLSARHRLLSRRPRLGSRLSTPGKETSRPHGHQGFSPLPRWLPLQKVRRSCDLRELRGRPHRARETLCQLSAGQCSAEPPDLVLGVSQGKDCCKPLRNLWKAGCSETCTSGLGLGRAKFPGPHHPGR